MSKVICKPGFWRIDDLRNEGGKGFIKIPKKCIWLIIIYISSLDLWIFGNSFFCNQIIDEARKFHRFKFVQKWNIETYRYSSIIIICNYYLCYIFCIILFSSCVKSLILTVWDILIKVYGIFLLNFNLEFA